MLNSKELHLELYFNFGLYLKTCLWHTKSNMYQMNQNQQKSQSFGSGQSICSLRKLTEVEQLKTLLLHLFLFVFSVRLLSK